MFFVYWRPHRLQTLEIKKMPQEHMKFYRLAKKSFEVYSLQSLVMTVVGDDSKKILILRPFKWLFDRNNKRATYLYLMQGIRPKQKACTYYTVYNQRLLRFLSHKLFIRPWSDQRPKIFLKNMLLCFRNYVTFPPWQWNILMTK